MEEPRGQELIDRYTANYGGLTFLELTEEMILRHWELEKSLTRELLESTPENRWEAFERCYSTLYGELPWLNQFEESGRRASPAGEFECWRALLGSPSKKIYEVGSGRGELITYLAECGFECKGTEITRERGEKHVSEHPNLSWGNSDGVHLDRFEEKDHYDFVISNQVIEHMHPDDLVDHFRGALAILVPGGRYIAFTPHHAIGPTDVSRVFKCERTMGMHLKEYTYSELVRMLKKAGYASVSAPCTRLYRLRGKLGGRRGELKASASFLRYLWMLERLIALMPTYSARKAMARQLKYAFFDTTICIVAKKAGKRLPRGQDK